MSTPPTNFLRHYYYDPLDQLSGARPSALASFQRFYQNEHLVTELGEHAQRTIIRHEGLPLAQQQSTAGAMQTRLLATDQAHSVLLTEKQQLFYTAYGYHPLHSGLSGLVGFNGESPDSVTGHYLLGRGTRAFNPVLMRFNSPDELSPFGEGGINSYAYCAGDPINRFDPTGNAPIFLLPRFKNAAMAGPSSSQRASVIVKNPLNAINPTSVAINRKNNITNNSMSAGSRSQGQPSSIPFPHKLPTTLIYSPKPGARLTPQLEDAISYDRQSTHNMEFIPMASPDLLAGWEKQKNLVQTINERTLPKKEINKRRAQLRKIELGIKQFSIRQHELNFPGR